MGQLVNELHESPCGFLYAVSAQSSTPSRIPDPRSHPGRLPEAASEHPKPMTDTPFNATQALTC